MPNLFVVGDQHSAAAITAALLPARHTAAERLAAIAALQDANPTLALDRLRPGMLLVVPDTIERLRRDAADDPAGDAADALLDQVREGLASLVQAAALAEQQTAEERKETFALLDGPDVSRLADDDLLARNIESVRKTLDQQEAAMEEQRVELRKAVDEWLGDVKELRGLL
jgi:hypothetical protein